VNTKLKTIKNARMSIKKIKNEEKKIYG